MPNPDLWCAQTNGSFMYCPAAMRIGGWVRPEGDKFRATTHNYWNDKDDRAPTIPMSEPSEVFDTLEEAQNWMEARWAAARRQAGLENK